MSRKTNSKKAVHHFTVECGCPDCDEVRAAIAYQEHLRRRMSRLLAPAQEHTAIDDAYIARLSQRLGVLPEHLAQFRQALLDTAEPMKDEVDWVADAGLILTMRLTISEEGEGAPDVPEGSLAAKILNREERVQ